GGGAAWLRPGGRGAWVGAGYRPRPARGRAADSDLYLSETPCAPVRAAAGGERAVGRLGGAVGRRRHRPLHRGPADRAVRNARAAAAPGPGSDQTTIYVSGYINNQTLLSRPTNSQREESNKRA